jgi:phage terminase small subunit|tara:strand:+ start:572 stop:982 length:411 start_codon:yes stop_codon:yes gene_type:complete
MTIKDKSLMQRKAEFVQHFLVTKNATESAKRTGYSEASAYNQGHRLMNDDEVQKMLAFELAESKERNLKDHDSIIERLKEEALGDVNGHTAGSRVKALELLMKYYQMIDSAQKVELSMKDSWFDTLDFVKEEDHLN